MDFLTETTVIQAGGITLGIISLSVLVYVIKMHRQDTKEYNKCLMNHTEHSNMAINKNTEVLGDMKAIIAGNTEVIRAVADKLTLKP